MSDHRSPKMVVNILVRDTDSVSASDLIEQFIKDGRVVPKYKGGGRTSACSVEMKSVLVNIETYCGSRLWRLMKCQKLFIYDVVLLVYDVDSLASLNSHQKSFFFRYGRHVSMAKTVLVGNGTTSPPHEEVEAEVDRLNKTGIGRLPTVVSSTTGDGVSDLFTDVLRLVIPDFKDETPHAVPRQCTPDFPTYLINQDRRRGACVVINNEKFLHLPDRAGTKHDASSLRKLFSNSGYKVIIENDMKGEQMREFLWSVSSNEVKDEDDSFVCCILSHGDRESLLGTDGKGVWVHEVFDPFTTDKCPKLKDKPRFFLMAACRGCEERFQTAGETDGPDQVDLDASPETRAPCPAQPDFLSAYATTENAVAYRTPDGTPFVQAFVECMDCHQAREHVEDILTRVAAQMNGNKLHGRKQIPCKYSTLTKRWIMPPGAPAVNSVEDAL